MPGVELEVVGNITASGTAAVNVLDLGTNTITDGNFTGNWDFNDGNLTSLGTLTIGEDDWIGIGASAERIVFDGDGDDIELLAGNVGIGTSSPAQKLSVEGIVQSTTGGYMFPDATVQQTAAPIIKSGTTTVGISIGPYSYFNISVPFGYTFSSPPTVTVTGYNAAGNPMTRLIPSVYSVSTSSFVLVLYNTVSSGNAGGYSFNWIAIGN